MKKSREIVNISLNRDSVCMADDINDHREIVFVPADVTAKDFVRTVCLNYLNGGSVWMGDWLVYSGDLDSDGLGELLFSIDTAHPCTIKIYSDWAAGKGIPEKIYFKYLIDSGLDKRSIGESKKIFTLYKEGLLAKLFKIRNREFYHVGATPNGFGLTLRF